MSLTRRDAFKLGFIKRCHDEGLVQEDQILDRAQQALTALEKRANPFVSLINKYHALDPQTQAKLLPLVLGAGVGLPLAGGVGAGMLASKLRGDWQDEEDVKTKEMTEELRRQADLAKQYSRIGGASPS